MTTTENPTNEVTERIGGNFHCIADLLLSLTYRVMHNMPNASVTPTFDSTLAPYLNITFLVYGDFATFGDDEQTIIELWSEQTGVDVVVRHGGGEVIYFADDPNAEVIIVTSGYDPGDTTDTSGDACPEEES